ncbi:epidermal differentiation-specific protein-like [Colossoma macropomum]|uniref:epidermal differentiation-specific protein-like n=1 Tax=Colossoma macropomum TaxID=42526 RepID=UPI0018648363|nr:epidermal differentiation-specific protein-like [Colossoma macropomum]
MNKVIVYEKPNFEGLSKEFTSNVSNLNDESFNDCISSVKVIGNPWVLYSDPNFSGYQYIFDEGEYPTVDWDNSTSSLEVVTEDLEDPQITLYDEPNYKGKSVVLTCETNLYYSSFDNSASSHKVQRGAWVLYQYANRVGYQMLARASRDMPDYEWFSNRLSHLRPLKPGKPTVTATVLWDKKEEQVKSVIIDSICGLNSGSREQTFNTELNREYEGSITDSFSFSNATQIGYETKFSVQVAEMSSEKTFSFSNTFTVEKGKTNTRTEKKSVRVSLPTTIPPRTKVTVNVVRKEVEVKVPVELIITTGFHKKTEYGQYVCSDGSSIISEFKEEPL